MSNLVSKIIFKYNNVFRITQLMEKVMVAYSEMKIICSCSKLEIIKKQVAYYISIYYQPIH